eukprot:gene16418-19489_t
MRNIFRIITPNVLIIFVFIISVVKISVEEYQAHTNQRNDTTIYRLNKYLQRMMRTPNDEVAPHANCVSACAQKFTESCFTLPLPEYARSSYSVDNNDTRVIPCLVHSMGPLTEELKSFSQSWVKCMPKECTFIHWEDDALSDFVSAHYPEYLELFSSAPASIIRFDMIRYLLLHFYGGIYRDIDYECMAPEHAFYLPHTANDSSAYDLKSIHIVGSPHAPEYVQNSLMASVKNHAFWIELMNDIQDIARTGWCVMGNDNNVLDVLASAGPRRLQKWVNIRRNNVNVLGIDAYYTASIPKSFARHHNRQSWTPDIPTFSRDDKKVGGKCAYNHYVC